MSLFTDTSMENYSVNRQQYLKIQYLEKEIDQLKEHNNNIEQSLSINKQIISQLLDPTSASDTSKSQNQAQVIQKLQAESMLSNQIIAQLKLEKEDIHAKVLILEQINEQYIQRDAENSQIFEETIIDLKEKLERKEFIMQLKEKKWASVEKLISELYGDDPVLLQKLSDLKFHLNQRGKITNVVEENERLKIEISSAQQEIINLKKKLFLAEKPNFLSEEWTDSNSNQQSTNKNDEDWQQYSQNLENCINFLRKKVTQIEKSKYELQISYRKLQSTNVSLQIQLEKNIKLLYTYRKQKTAYRSRLLKISSLNFCPKCLIPLSEGEVKMNTSVRSLLSCEEEDEGGSVVENIDYFSSGMPSGRGGESQRGIIQIPKLSGLPFTGGFGGGLGSALSSQRTTDLQARLGKIMNVQPTFWSISRRQMNFASKLKLNRNASGIPNNLLNNPLDHLPNSVRAGSKYQHHRMTSASSIRSITDLSNNKFYQLQQQKIMHIRGISEIKKGAVSLEQSFAESIQDQIEDQEQDFQ